MRDWLSGSVAHQVVVVIIRGIAPDGVGAKIKEQQRPHGAFLPGPKLSSYLCSSRLRPSVTWWSVTVYLP